MKQDTPTFKASQLTRETINDYEVVRCEHKQKPVLCLVTHGEQTHLHNDELPEVDGMLQTEVEITERKDATAFLIQKFFISFGLSFSDTVLFIKAGFEEATKVSSAIDLYLDCIEDDEPCEIQDTNEGDTLLKYRKYKRDNKQLARQILDMLQENFEEPAFDLVEFIDDKHAVFNYPKYFDGKFDVEIEREANYLSSKAKWLKDNGYKGSLFIAEKCIDIK